MLHLKKLIFFNLILKFKSFFFFVKNKTKQNIQGVVAEPPLRPWEWFGHPLGPNPQKQF
jgi:hypothetical protein